MIPRTIEIAVMKFRLVTATRFPRTPQAMAVSRHVRLTTGINVSTRYRMPRSGRP